jgi:hypothetical protein
MEKRININNICYRYEINTDFESISNFILSIPEIFDIKGEEIYTGRNTIKIFKYKDYIINVKSFKIPHLINKIAYRYIRYSKAKKSFYQASEIIKRVSKTPIPIAYFNGSKSGLFNRSFFVSVHHKYDFTVRELIGFDFENKEEILRQLTRFTFYNLHKKDIHHKDYSRGNVLINKIDENTYDFSIVDINRLKFEKFDYIKGLKNFSQFWAEENEIEIFADEYAKLNNQDSTKAIEMLNNFNKEHKQKINKKLKLKAKIKRK